MIFSVIKKSNEAEIIRYSSISIKEEVNGVLYSFDEYEHIEYIEDTPILSIDTSNWKIWVGSFFDRFEPYKLAVLSSEDPLIKAAILDASVRKYIDLYGRREELSNLIDYIQSKGFVIDKTKILDLAPSEEEVWYG